MCVYVGGRGGGGEQASCEGPKPKNEDNFFRESKGHKSSFSLVLLSVANGYVLDEAEKTIDRLFQTVKQKALARLPVHLLCKRQV